MSLEQKFLSHSDLAVGPRLRLWIGGALIAWAFMLAAILNMVVQPDSRIAEDGGSLNEIAPAAGPDQEADSTGPGGS